MKTYMLSLAIPLVIAAAPVFAKTSTAEAAYQLCMANGFGSQSQCSCVANAWERHTLPSYIDPNLLVSYANNWRSTGGDQQKTYHYTADDLGVTPIVAASQASQMLSRLQTAAIYCN